MSVEVVTLGCRMNLAESETLRAMLGGDDDLVVVNSCAVTAEALRHTRQAIRRARRARPDARLLVTGCAAEVERAMIAARDWRALIQYGASFFLLEKLAPIVGQGNLDIYAAMRGISLEAFQQTRNQQITYSVAGQAA